LIDWQGVTGLPDGQWERLIVEADAAVLCTLDLDTPEWDAYFGVTQ